MVMRASEIQIPPVPAFAQSGKSASEWKEFRPILSYLGLVSQGANQFVSAISLFEFAKNNKDKDQVQSTWQVVAAREGAISLNDMYIGIKLTCQALCHVPKSDNIADPEVLIAAQRYFAEHFPNIEKIRHVIVHQEFYNNIRSSNGQHIRYMDEQMYFSANASLESLIAGSRWISAWEGETVGYNITNESAHNARKTCALLYSAFS